MTVKVDKDLCMSCGGCVGVCPKLALELEEGINIICDEDKCTSCGICVKFCPVHALELIK